MNISTGGPHLLLFERDQQLASLLISELQLAGYECHTARTAVEVFDAIARFPIRMVLVNLAQAAAARREFWVALDTQRRGRGVQVFTFHCVNIAGYGAQDPDERSQTTMADMEVDGMMGLMNLVDAVRARIPGPGSAATNTMPRLSKISATPPPASPRPVPAPPTTGSTIYRSTSSLDAQPYQPSAFTNVQSTTNLPPSIPTAPQQQPAAFTTPAADASEVSSSGQSSYTDRIRAVLYPNQKSWSSSSTGLTPPPEVRTEQDLQRPAQSASRSAGMSGTAALQRLASGQSNLEGARESGLAQLSRLLQDYRTPTIEDTSAVPPLQEPGPAMYPTTSRLSSPSTSSLTGTVSAQPSQPVNQPTTSMPTTSYGQQQMLPSAPSQLPINNVEVRLSRQDDRPIGTQPLRAAPIQELMENRNTVGLVGSEAYARQNNAQAPASPVPPLSSIAPASASTPVPPPSYAPAPTVIPVSASTVTAVPNRENAVPPYPTTVVPNRENTAPPQVEVVEDKKQLPVDRLAEVANAEQRTDNKPQFDGYVDEELSPAITMHGTSPVFSPETSDTAAAFPLEIPDTIVSDALLKGPNSATLIDIMESFPPMPPPKAQPPQQTVLNGRATRSLGSVLLAGHLVPENRLEVAQHIQRMLSGVDMNYQLGEILLMFKLLTPDQLLAASLVSYGLISTQQISALGRIRQELHAIGLEYDLENLLILFRILTPEQIREAKSNRQS